MEKEEEVDRRRSGKVISKSAHGWTLPTQAGQLKTGPDGKELLRIHLWFPMGQAMLWVRLDYSI